MFNITVDAAARLFFEHGHIGVVQIAPGLVII